MSDINIFNHHLKDSFENMFYKGVNLASKCCGHVFKLFQNIPQELRNLSSLTIAVVAVANVIFLILLNEGIKRLPMVNEGESEEKTYVKFIKAVLIHGGIVGGGAVGFNLMLSKIFNYPMSKTMQAMVATTAIVARLLGKRLFDLLKKDKSLENAGEVAKKSEGVSKIVPNNNEVDEDKSTQISTQESDGSVVSQQVQEEEVDQNEPLHQIEDELQDNENELEEFIEHDSEIQGGSEDSTTNQVPEPHLGEEEVGSSSLKEQQEDQLHDNRTDLKDGSHPSEHEDEEGSVQGSEQGSEKQESSEDLTSTVVQVPKATPEIVVSVEGLEQEEEQQAMTDSDAIITLKREGSPVEPLTTLTEKSQTPPLAPETPPRTDTAPPANQVNPNGPPPPVPPRKPKNNNNTLPLARAPFTTGISQFPKAQSDDNPPKAQTAPGRVGVAHLRDTIGGTMGRSFMQGGGRGRAPLPIPREETPHAAQPQVDEPQHLHTDEQPQTEAPPQTQTETNTTQTETNTNLVHLTKDRTGTRAVPRKLPSRRSHRTLTRTQTTTQDDFQILDPRLQELVDKYGEGDATKSSLF